MGLNFVEWRWTKKPCPLVHFLFGRFEFEIQLFNCFKCFKSWICEETWGSNEIIDEKESKFFHFYTREKVPDFWGTLYARTRRSALVGSPQFALRELVVGTVTSATKPFGSLSLFCPPPIHTMFLSSRIFTAKEVTDGHAIIRNSFSEDDYSLARSSFLPFGRSR